jgi:hypothetical protein
VHATKPETLRVFDDLDSIAAQERLASAEIDLVQAELGELVENVFPFNSREFVGGRGSPTPATDAAEVAVVGQEELRHEWRYMQVRLEMLLHR